MKATLATTHGNAVAVAAQVQHEIERFLFHEAELLDDRRFDDWLALFADDTHYWMPTRRSLGRRQTQDFGGEDEAPHFDDDKQSLSYRVARLSTAFAWAEQPPSRTRHIIANIRASCADADETYHVRSNFLLYVNRFEKDMELFAGQRTDVLRRESGSSFRIASRAVLLDQTVILANSISVFF